MNEYIANGIEGEKRNLELPDGWHLQLYERPDEFGWFFRAVEINNTTGEMMFFIKTPNAISEDQRKAVLDMFKKVKAGWVSDEAIKDLKARIEEWDYLRDTDPDYHEYVLSWFTEGSAS